MSTILIRESPATQDLNALKTTLLNTVCASMIAEPKFGPEDIVSNAIRTHVKEIAMRDPEFILKLALYVRDDLNIRSTANFLTALAADTPQCTPYMRKYFKAIVRLPSDWLDIAALYQMLPERKLQGRAIPTCLREAMRFKFSAFDAYQLGKYNKEGKIKRKAKKAKNEKSEKDNEKKNRGDDSGDEDVRTKINRHRALRILQRTRTRTSTTHNAQTHAHAHIHAPPPPLNFD